MSEEVEQPQSQASSADDQERLFAAIGYFAMLFVVPIIAKPKSKYCQMHAKQSMVLFLVAIFVLVILAAIPLLGSLFTLALFALYVLAIYRAYSGEAWEIPMVSDLARKIDLSSLYSTVGGAAISAADKMKEKAEDVADTVSDTVKKDE